MQRIHRFLSGEIADFSEIMTNYDKTRVINYLIKYINYFPQDKEKVEEIIDNIDYYYQIKCEDFNRVIRNLSSKSEYSKCIEICDMLLNNSEGDAISYLRKAHFSDENFNSILTFFRNTFPNQPEIKQLELLYKKYKEIYSCKLKKEQPIDIDYRVELIKKIYESGKTIEEYCSITGERFDDCHKAIESKRNQMDKEVSAILNRDNCEFERMIKVMAYKFIQEPNFDLTMYYDFTKLSFIDFYNSCKKIISNEKVYEKVRILMKKSEKTLKIRISKDIELEGRTIIAGREITREEKEKVFDYLEEKEYPISLYSVVLRKYLLGSISFDKQKTYEK